MRTLGPLTEKQERVLEYIRGYIEENKYPPTITDIGEYMGVRQVSAWSMLCSMRKKGAIDWEVGKPRTIKVLEVA